MRFLPVLIAAVVLVQQPQFRGGVELVTVDVRVIGPGGQPVTDLRPEDIALKVDGKVRAIKSLNLLRAGAMSAPAIGRTLILVFDNEHIRPNNQKPAVDGAIKALDALGPGDRVALVTLPNGRVVVNLTTDLAQIRQALPLMIGGYHDTLDLPDGGSMRAERVMCAMYALRDFFNGLRKLAGPKTIVLVSEGFTCEGPSGYRDTRLDGRPELADLAAAAGAARAQVYVIQPSNSMIIDSSRALRKGLPDDEGQRRDDAQGTIENIATVTGGDLFRLSATADAVYARVIRETSAYYELAFEPAESDRNGKDHAISVKVSRPKTLVRARPSFSIPK